MLFSRILLQQGLVSESDIERALERQHAHGGRLGDNLVALGLLDEAQLSAVMASFPPMPISVEETGLSDHLLLDLVLKVFRQTDADTAQKVAEIVKLPVSVVEVITKEAARRHYLEAAGEATRSIIPQTRYRLTATGRASAAEAIVRSGYVGPAPVPLEIYQAKVRQQRIAAERVTLADLERAFARLVIPKGLLMRLGPALNSGQALLMYGPPGNGKTAIAEAAANVYRDAVFIPYAIEIAGQIIKMFDPAVHDPVRTGEAADSYGPLRAEQFDERWVACRRPFVVAGGELTLDMLDLKFEPTSKHYEAPLQLKATNGIFLIDDFGRQLVRPEDLLNRWIVPLERRLDFLTLHTGGKFPVIFDELVIFSTNFSPQKTLDGAMLRRIPYKIEIEGPTEEEFKSIFRLTAQAKDVALDEAVLDDLIMTYYREQNRAFASYHPKFLLDQIVASCRFLDQPPHLSRALMEEALINLTTSH